ncbi:UDP-glucuronate 4-epimerase [Arcticibacter pallidicorallinus]|uniref:UDP-glucuronate 4-epimerase n=1 Tax=Arcticibacter pallidicorallinus TaxID=1259464 RepID=A0A2T0TRM5_9SPHI|nr:NAD-dependent epimerase [Arcticibacter pallidicorallinus]PRY48307.1 UDP-glucuronate 4-epimerase [Arcticibacter pallidicorallinus]
MRVLVTGSAGFIGFHLVKRLLIRGDEVVGIDNINDYYDVDLKYGRLLECGISKDQIQYGRAQRSETDDNYQFMKLDLTDKKQLDALFQTYRFDVVVNLAAQAGVRYSLIDPSAYIESNIKGFLNILECCRFNAVKHLVYASSSSVYGLNEKMPFSEVDKVDTPVSLYAASKKSNELMAHSYSHLFGLATTGLRFFTVYGPWGRPDMALFKFTKAITEGRPIEVYNYGNMKRDFTYIDDIIEGVVRIIDRPVTLFGERNDDKALSGVRSAPYQIFNIGRGKSVSLMTFINEIEKNLEKTALKRFLPLQDGDVADTWADVADLERSLDYKPAISVEEGVSSFVRWYKEFYLNNQIPTRSLAKTSKAY